MDDMKDKFKGFVKKVNNPFTSSSSGKFKGQGRVLGSSTPSSSSSSLPSNSSSLHDSRNVRNSPNPVNSKANTVDQKVNANKLEKSRDLLNEKPKLGSGFDPYNGLLASGDGNRNDPNNVDQKVNANKLEKSQDLSNENPKLGGGFDPYNALITSGERNRNGYELKVFECPICGRGYGSEEEVSEHVENCLSSSEAGIVSGLGELDVSGRGVGEKSEVEVVVAGYLSGKPSEGSVEVVLKLLRNVVSDPGNGKFRKFRMGNAKIREAIGDVAGGVELLEFIGFELKEEEGEMFAVMDVPSEEGIGKVKDIITLLEGKKRDDVPTPTIAKLDEPVQVEPKRIDRQIKVFFSIHESVAAKIVVPDSFYNLSSQEVKREAEMRRKKIDESKLLIPKSYKEKQAKAARKRYNRTVIRVQFPDGVVLQGVFLPSEFTSALYEFVSSSLKEPSLEFELLHPVPIKRRVIPHSPDVGKKPITLEEEDLVPAALIKFRPVETDSVVFTGLCNELLEISEPLTNESAVPS